MDISRISDELFVGTTPAVEDYDHLRRLGVSLVINMRIEKRPVPDPHDPPLRFLWLPTVDSPLLPIPIRFLMCGAQAAVETIRQGGKVFAHCAGGRHRGAAMGAAILTALGHPPDEAVQMIKVRRPSADPDVFYIRGRILRFARCWQSVNRAPFPGTG